VSYIPYSAGTGCRPSSANPDLEINPRTFLIAFFHVLPQAWSLAVFCLRRRTVILIVVTALTGQPFYYYSVAAPAGRDDSSTNLMLDHELLIKRDRGTREPTTDCILGVITS
jgi:hypothetical protein